MFYIISLKNAPTLTPKLSKFQAPQPRPSLWTAHMKLDKAWFFSALEIPAPGWGPGILGSLLSKSCGVPWFLSHRGLSCGALSYPKFSGPYSWLKVIVDAHFLLLCWAQLCRVSPGSVDGGFCFWGGQTVYWQTFAHVYVVFRSADDSMLQISSPQHQDTYGYLFFLFFCFLTELVWTWMKVWRKSPPHSRQVG